MAKQTSVTKPFFQRLATFMVAGFVIGSSMSIVSIVAFSGAQSVEELREQTEQLDREIEESSEQAENLANQASSLQDAIRSYDNQIERVNQQIRDINAQVNRLEGEIKQAEEDLERQKELLRNNMRALYVRGDASTIELLAASDSFSEFIDEQEYLERLKGAIQDSANKVIELQEQLEDQKAEQEQLLEQERKNKQSLEEVRVQRSNLLAETQGKEREYRSLVKKLEEQRKEAEAQIAKALAARSYQAAPVGHVSAGDVVGAIGNTGLSSGPHLHLETRINGGDTNPAPYIRSQPVAQPPAWVSQGYGNPASLYLKGYHPGIDYAGPSGTPLFAIDDGYMYRGCSNDLLGTSNNAYGYVAIIEHSNGVMSIYAHMSGGPSACDYNVSPW